MRCAPLLNVFFAKVSTPPRVCIRLLNLQKLVQLARQPRRAYIFVKITTPTSL